MKFLKLYDDIPAPVTNPGNKREIKYIQRIDHETGRKYLQENGSVDLVARIRSCKDMCSIESLIKKYVATGGDSSVLNVRKGVFMDMTNVPTSVPEMFDIVQRAKVAFESLPIEEKMMFDNDPAVYFASKQAEMNQNIEKKEIVNNGTDEQ